MEKLIVEDLSTASIDIFPVESLLDFIELDKLQFVYIVSPLLFSTDIKKLKMKSKEALEKRPYFIGRFFKERENRKMSEVSDLPMHFQKHVCSPYHVYDIDLCDFF